MASFGNRVWLTFGVVLALARCGGGGCACIQPLEGPFPEAKKNAQVVQARITPEGFSFVGQKLPEVVGSFLSMACDGPTGVPCPTGTSCACPAGQTCTQCPANNPACTTATNPRQCIPANPAAAPLLGFRVPPNDGEDTDICTTGIGAGWNNCLIYARLKSSNITPTNASDANVRVTVDIFTTTGNTGGIVIEYDPWFLPATTCRIYPSIQDRAINATLRVGRDARTDRATFDIPQIDVPFSGDDINIDGGFLCDVADIGFIKDWIVGSFAGDLSTTLKDALMDAMDPIRTQTCDPDLTTYQCPRLANGEQTVCNRQDERCHFASGTQALVPGLLGVEGILDLGSSLGGFLSLPGGVEFTAYAGGIKQGGGSAAYFATGGLHVGMVGGANAAPNACVPPRQRDTSPVPTFNFPATVAPANGGTATTYMLGAALHERLTQEVLGEAYAGGLLCQEITSRTLGLIHSGIIGLLLGEGSTLGELYRDNKNRPAIMALKPRAAPEVHIGLGRQSPDPMDPTRIILDEPLLALVVPNLDMDIYVMLDDRYVRLVTLTLDLVVGLGLELNAMNQVHLVANPVDSWIKNVRAANGDILNQTPAEIAAAVPELLGAFLPQFAPSLDQTFDLPSLQGFALRDVRFKGMETTGTQSVFNKTRYRFLGLFANLEFNRANVTPQHLTVETHAQLAELVRPAPEKMLVTLGAARERVRARLAVDAQSSTGLPLEHSYRVDGGLWHPYMRGDTLWISDAELNLQGWHDVEVRSRVVDAPETLDVSPVTVRVLSDVETPRLQVTRDGRTLHVAVWDRVTPASDVTVRVRAGGGAWETLPGGEQRTLDLGVDLDPDARIDVEATDEAQLVAAATVGNPAWTPRDARTLRTIRQPTPASDVASQGGLFSCAGTNPAPSGILLLLLALRLRPRRR